MRHLSALVFSGLLLTACTKDDQSVSYSATCDHCYVWYTTDAREMQTADVHGTWNVFVVDTITTLEDTTYVLDSTYAIGQWNMDTEIDHDAIATVRARNEFGSASTSVSMTVNGTAKQGTTTEYMGEVRL